MAYQRGDYALVLKRYRFVAAQGNADSIENLKLPEVVAASQALGRG